MAFMKHDKGKVKYHLIPPEVLKAVAEVFTDGAAKYEPDGWRECDDPNRYLDALYRHLVAWQSGETYDLDSARHTLAHVAANAMILLGLDLARIEQIDRDRVNRMISDFVDHQEVCRYCSGIGLQTKNGIDSEQCSYCEGSGRVLGRTHDA